MVGHLKTVYRRLLKNITFSTHRYFFLDEVHQYPELPIDNRTGRALSLIDTCPFILSLSA